MKITKDGGLSYQEELEAILGADLSEMEKLAAAFGGLTGFVVEVAENEIELAKALGDQQALIKQQIKIETMKSARDMFRMVFWRVTGRWAWDEPIKR